MKHRMIKWIGLASVLIFALLTAGTWHVEAEEGMWTFDNLPLKVLKEKYGFEPTQEWLDHVRLASVRFMDGGSGSFVSPNGLVMTNHHVGVGQLQKISTPELDYVATGFYAAEQADELKCADLEVNVLVDMENVTDRVKTSVKEKMSASEALKARETVIAQIEKESLDKTGLRSNVVDLYHGGEYWLYQYKKYTDVRMVMAPERQAAYFGGDFDNFTYPRYDLDITFFRVYENDKRVRSDHYFKWNAKGAAEGDLVFVSGNPGSTDRLYTYAQLEFQRDYNYPMVLKLLQRAIADLRQYSQKGPEQERRALIQIFGLANSQKAMTGEYEGLLDENVMAKRRGEEEEFRNQIASRPEWQQAYGKAWETIETLTVMQQDVMKNRFYRRFVLSRFAGLAQNIVFYVQEVEKPDTDRLNGYHESQLDGMRFNLFSPAPIFSDLEEAQIASWLSLVLEELGPEDPFVKTVLNGESPAAAAARLTSDTKLADAEFRKKLVEGGINSVNACQDPFIVLMRKLEPEIRSQIEWGKKNITSKLTPAAEQIAQARFAVFGKGVNPDATFTLRLSFGSVKGYPMNGTKAPHQTTLYGLFDRALSFGNQGDYALPQRFWDRKDRLDLSTPVNFVSTCDIIGGNSGSPVINAKAEVVGLIFDGNIESLVGRFVYDIEKNRAVSVHTAFITEALRKLYDAGKLADEIQGQ